MTPDMIATYTFLRDNAKPCSEQDAADLEAIRAPMPPSKGHLKRLSRADRPFVEQPRAYAPAEPEIRRQLDFHKRVLAELGGTRTIVPVRGCERKAAYGHVLPDARREIQPRDERKMLQDNIDRLRRDFESERAKVIYYPKRRVMVEGDL